jgi:hypothetical protein
VCFRDPGVGVFGLENALMGVGDQFLEVVAPVRPDTTAGRLLAKRDGDGGYMAIFEVDDLDRRIEQISSAGVRIVWSGEVPGIRGCHLHPSDVGGTLVSIDQPTTPGEWPWAGPSWRSQPPAAAVSAIAAVTISAVEPASMRSRWADLGLEDSVQFSAAGLRGEGLDLVDVVAADRARVGDAVDLGGVRFRFV